MCIFTRESFRNSTIAPCNVISVHHSPVDTQLWTLEDANNPLRLKDLSRKKRKTMLLKIQECTLPVVSILIYRSRNKSPDSRSKIICGAFLYTMCDIRIRRVHVLFKQSRGI